MAGSPKLGSLTIPSSIDVTGGTASIPVQFNATDDNDAYPMASQIDGITITFSQPIEYEVPPHGVPGSRGPDLPGYTVVGQSVVAHLPDEHYDYSAGLFFNTYSSTFTPLPANTFEFNLLLGSETAAGAYQITSVTLQDYANQTTTFDAAQLDSLGINRSIDVTSNATVTSVCFCRGTSIRTPGGNVAVERLSVGDEVLTISGVARAIRWIGSAHSIVTNINRPVVILAGAFSEGSPTHDVSVTRGHAFLFGDVLIPIGELVNDRSILWDNASRRMEIFHIALDRHDILLANGAPAESYRDDGNRNNFPTETGYHSAVNATPTFAPVVTKGPIVDRTYRKLSERADAQSPTVLGSEFVSSSIS